ncbi:hypothetical protein L1987_31256 [Smallanthus sonchifolius]|uniref:Uncharacterized protein n=1 Tax=Smallanthus sonchifolius TaxID=185202 RepID=A0ACB9I4W2_9ASTR|nr:hypothetical protein L1987_31256 [Smallanthus sonchifolius]
MGEDSFHLRGNLSNSLSALTVNERDQVNNKLVEEQDVLQQIEEQQEEIMQLRRHLAEYAAKEARIENEKKVLEKRIASIYKGFDQQQQDLIEASSKAIAYKQGIIEENIHLKYALQVAQEEELIFISSLVPLLSEQSLQPATIDAYSIISNLRILFKHYKETLAVSEEKLRDSQYQSLVLHSHRKDLSLNDSSHPEPVHTGVEKQNNGEDGVNSHYLPSILEEEQEPSSSSHPEADDSEEDDNGSGDYDDIDTNKPLPTVEDLQIIGEPFPGEEIQASGYSRNGTTGCGFEWVRYLQVGSIKYIEGAKQPTYTVTADDVDNYLAVLVQPLDERNRKGEVVKCFANASKKITCHPDMLHEIEKTASVGRASFKLLVLRESPDTWEPSILEIKKSSYRIKLNGPNSGVVVVDNKYTPTTIINLPAEEPLEFSILGPDGVEQYLRADYNPTDISCSRDTVVLTMRLFVKRAVDKNLGKKTRRGLFFKSNPQDKHKDDPISLSHLTQNGSEKRGFCLIHLRHYFFSVPKELTFPP